jgi:glucose/arabinose dehydrogenase
LKIRRALTCAGAVAAASGVVATAAQAAGPPLPKASNGKPVTFVAGGLTTPTSFAFGDGVIFEGDGGSLPTSPGGVYVIKNGTATKLNGSPGFVSGLAWRKGTLYVAGGSPGPNGATFQILAWSGWNGTEFTKQKAIYTAPKKFQGFNGLAFGPDGRLYIGVDVGLLNGNDHGPAKTPYVYDVLSINTNGKGLKVYARGIRQPWQLTFAKGDTRPFVTDFGQDCTGKNPCPNNAKPPAVPDFVLHVKAGDNYGFPKCNWTKSSNCSGFTTPFRRFAPHTDVGGITAVGKTLYIGEFGFDQPAHKPQVVTMSTSGGKVKPFLTGSPVPIIAVGASGGFLYVGAAGRAPGTGFVYRVSLAGSAATTQHSTSRRTTSRRPATATSPGFTG